MKKLWTRLVLLCMSCLLSTFAVAQTAAPAPAVTDRLFMGSTSPEQWQNTKALWQEHKVIVGDEVVIDEVVKIAKGTAKSTNHPAGQLSESDFAKAFSQRNGGLPATGKVKTDLFHFMAQGQGIFLPTASVAAVAPQGAAAPVANAPVNGATSPASPDAKQAVAIANIEGQVKALQDEVRKAGGSQKEAAAVLSTRLSEFGRQVKALQDGQGGFAVKADITAANKALADFKTEVGDLAKLRADVTGLQTGQAQFAAELEKLKQNPILAWGSWLLAAIGALFLLCFATIFLTRRASKAEVKAVKGQLSDEIASANTLVQEALGTAQKAKVESAAAVTKVTAVEGEVKKLTGRREVVFPPDFDAKVDDLTEAGQKYHLMVMVDDEQECHLAISLRSDNLYDILGIEDLTTGVSRKGLKKTIGNAATVIDGKSRLVGVAPKSVDSSQSAPEQSEVGKTEIPAYLLRRRA